MNSVTCEIIATRQLSLRTNIIPLCVSCGLAWRKKFIADLDLPDNNRQQVRNKQVMNETSLP